MLSYLDITTCETFYKDNKIRGVFLKKWISEIWQKNNGEKYTNQNISVLMAVMNQKQGFGVFGLDSIHAWRLLDTDWFISVCCLQIFFYPNL